MAGLKRESMPFSGMKKLKLKFFKGMWNKITKSIFYFPFILELKTKTRKRLSRHMNISTMRRRKKTEEKRKHKK